jgi:endonuclease III related protein
MDYYSLYTLLLEAYGLQGWWPLTGRAGSGAYNEKGYHPGVYHLPESGNEQFEIALGAVLTQNCSWHNVRICLERLSAAGLVNGEIIAQMDETELADYIRSSGYYKQKSRKLRILSRFLVEGSWLQGCAGNKPSRAELLNLWGIGEESADSILLYAYGVPCPVVDASARRILARFVDEPSLSDETIRRGMEFAALKGEAEGTPPVSFLNEFHALLVKHGKAVCTKRNPRCPECCLLSCCAYDKQKV